jgi:hypothetical protein
MASQSRPTARIRAAENDPNIRASLVRQAEEHERRAELIRSNLQILDRNEKKYGGEWLVDVVREDD